VPLCVQCLGLLLADPAAFWAEMRCRQRERRSVARDARWQTSLAILGLLPEEGRAAQYFAFFPDRRAV